MTELSITQFISLRHEADKVACPSCGARAGLVCRDLFDGDEVWRRPAHELRLSASAHETVPALFPAIQSGR